MSREQERSGCSRGPQSSEQQAAHSASDRQLGPSAAASDGPAPASASGSAPYVPQPVYPPAPLMQLTGGMKFGWLVVGALLGIPGIIIAWLANADKVAQVKSDALKFSIIGFVIWILGLLTELDDRRHGYGACRGSDGFCWLLWLRLPRILVVGRFYLGALHIRALRGSSFYQ